MVVAVPGQLVQGDAPNVEIGVPGVERTHDFVATGIRLEPAQAVVLDVVDGLQKQKGDDADRHCEEQPRHAEQRMDAQQVGGLNEVVPEHVVLDREEGLALPLEQVALDPPCARVLAGD